MYLYVRISGSQLVHEVRSPLGNWTTCNRWAPVQARGLTTTDLWTARACPECARKSKSEERRTR